LKFVEKRVHASLGARRRKSEFDWGGELGYNRNARKKRREPQTKEGA